jgi:UDP-N-acetyl-D-glucosamine dehydrogenase
VIGQLQRRGAVVLFHDPYTPRLLVNGRSLDASTLSRRLIEGVDCVALLTPHTAYDLDWMAEHSKLIFDARNAYGDASHANVTRL